MKLKVDEIDLHYVDHKLLKPLQGNLKEVSDTAYKKIRSEIESEGFKIPFFVWDRGEEGLTILDGHTRLKVIETMNGEGYEIPHLPCVFIKAESYKQAKKLLLAITSSYGKIQGQGLYEFMDDIDLDLDELESRFDLEAIDFDIFSDEFFKEDDSSMDWEAKTGGSLAEKFICPPLSVLDLRMGYFRKRQQMWNSIGLNSGASRDNVLGSSAKLTNKTKSGFSTVAVNTSIFNPVLAEVAYTWFCPPDGVIIDPFAGGEVRGVVASHLNRRYIGIDIRQEQVNENIDKIDIANEDYCPIWKCADSINIASATDNVGADFIYSCPPYGDLEKYSKLDGDISNMSYDDFMVAYRKIIAESCRLLNDDSFACFVVGDIRDKSGHYRSFVADTVSCFRDAGLQLYNDMVVVTNFGTLAMTAPRAFKASRKVGKAHQNMLVFVKGDAKKATSRIGDIAVMDISQEDSLPRSC